MFFNWKVEGIHKKDGVKKTVTCTLESSKVNKASMTKKEVAGLNKINKHSRVYPNKKLTTISINIFK